MNDTDYILEVEKILILHVENQNNTVTGGDLVGKLMKIYLHIKLFF